MKEIQMTGTIKLESERNDSFFLIWLQGISPLVNSY